MELTLIGICLIFTRVNGELNYVSDVNSEKHETKLYDVLAAVQNIDSAINLDKRKEFLVNSNVHNKVKLLNFINLIPALINSISNASNSTCYADLTYVKENINFKNVQNSWALEMLDAFGKPESGLLEGNVKWLGDFDECRSVYAPKKVDSDFGGFYGQYCILQVTVAEVLPLSIGVCLPDTCNESEFKYLFNVSNLIPALNNSGIELNITSLTCKANSLELSNGGIVTLCIMSVLFFLVILGSSITAFKYFTDLNTSENLGERDKIFGHIMNGSLDEPLQINEGSSSKLRVFIDKLDPFLNCFCFFTNGSKLLSTGGTEGQLLCLHGIRFLSMTWVIMCHVYMSAIAEIRTSKNILPLVDNLPFQVMLNGWYSVDSFFVLSGFLMSYLYFQECAKRDGKTPWLYFYVHRYLRLTPVYMLVLAFFATVMPVMGSGPFWVDKNIDPGCQQGWWWNLIYINNFQSQNEQCMTWSWYLANDMQFFVISPLFLITLWRWPKFGYSILVLLLCGSWLSGFLITYHYDLLAGTLSYIYNTMNDPSFASRFADFFDKIYVKPYTRISPYLIGIGLGYILFKRKITNTRIDRIALWTGWFLATTVGLYCIYGFYHQTPSQLASSFFNAFTRTGYGLSLSWLIFVCLSGQGGVVNDILSFKLFIPLSRLTYCAYLIHPIVIVLYFTSLKTTIAFTHQTIVIMYLGLLIVSYAFAMLVSLAFESPIIRLEKLVRNKFQNR